MGVSMLAGAYPARHHDSEAACTSHTVDHASLRADPIAARRWHCPLTGVPRAILRSRLAGDSGRTPDLTEIREVVNASTRASSR